MVERDMYYDNVVSRVIFSYDINRLYVELRGSNQHNRVVFEDTLYYNNTNLMKGKKIKAILELDDSEASEDKRNSLLKDLSCRIPLSEGELKSFIAEESYKIYELISDAKKASYVIAKSSEILFDVEQVAS